MQIDQLKRREFITLLGGGVAGWPLPALAQQPGGAGDWKKPLKQWEADHVQVAIERALLRLKNTIGLFPRFGCGAGTKTVLAFVRRAESAAF